METTTSSTSPLVRTEPISQNEAASCVYHIAERLQRPLYYLLNNILGRLSTVLTPGRFGNYDSKLAEIIRRIFLACLAIPVAVVSLGGSIGALYFNYRGDVLLGNQPYLCLQGTYRGPPRDTFATFNMSTLLPPMTLLDGVDNSEERLKNIAQLLKDFHFVCGQEVDGASARFLAEELKDHFVEFYTYLGKSNMPLMPSGLFFASKEKPLAITVTPFTGAVQKDIKRVYVIFEFADYCVVNTHLDGGSGEKVVKTHAEEIRQIITALRPYTKPLIFCGDFNEDRYTPTEAYYALTEHFVDCIKEQQSDKHVITCTDALKRARFGKKGPPTEESIDYIAYPKDQARLKVEFVEAQDHFYASDHRLVVGKFTRTAATEEEKTRV